MVGISKSPHSARSRGLVKFTPNPKVLVEGPVSGPSTCRGCPPAAKLAAKQVDEVDAGRQVVTPAAKVVSAAGDTARARVGLPIGSNK